MGVGVEKVWVDKWFLKNLNDAAHEFFLASYIAFFYFDTFSFLYLLFYIYICCIKRVIFTQGTILIIKGLLYWFQGNFDELGKMYRK